MWHKPHTYLKTASFILGISILSACTKQKDDDPNYPNLMPNAEAIIVDIPSRFRTFVRLVKHQVLILKDLELKKLKTK